jgi:hypothetical protein
MLTVRSSAAMVLGVVTICIANAAAARLKGLRPFFRIKINDRSKRGSESFPNRLGFLKRLQLSPSTQGRYGALYLLICHAALQATKSGVTRLRF